MAVVGNGCAVPELPGAPLEADGSMKIDVVRLLLQRDHRRVDLRE